MPAGTFEFECSICEETFDGSGNICDSCSRVICDGCLNNEDDSLCCECFDDEVAEEDEREWEDEDELDDEDEEEDEDL